MTGGTARMPDNPVEAVETLVRLAEKAHRHGTGALAEDAGHADNQVLGNGLARLVTGASEPELKAAMGRQISEAQANGVGDVTVMRMVETAILSMAAGDDPQAVREKLVALLTPEEQQRLQRHASPAGGSPAPDTDSTR